MDFLSLVESRQSDRKYDSTRPVEKEKIDSILAAAHLTPSACNAQPWHIIVVDNSEKIKEVSTALQSGGMNKFGFEAPVHLIIVEEKPNLTSWFGGLVKNKHFPFIDNGILTAHITLAATEQGLGSCIVGWFDEKKIKKALDIPSSKRVLLDIVIGYSLDKHRDKVRKPIDQVVSYNKYK